MGSTVMGSGERPKVYEIRIEGHLDDHWSGRLGGMRITREADGTTTLAGPVTDQAHLYGVLGGLRDIGATLLSLTTRAGDDVPAGEVLWPVLPDGHGENVR